MQKITDEELLDAIWIQQLKKLARRVINHFIGGSINVCRDEEGRYIQCCDLHVMRREKITDKIGRKQLLHRIRKLVNDGKLRLAYDPSILLTFIIDGESTKNAFNDSRKFWIDYGVPYGYHELKDGRTYANTTKIIDFDELLPQCEKMLLDKYGDRRK